MKTIRVEISAQAIVLVMLAGIVSVSGVALAAVAGTDSRWNGNSLEYQGSSGNDAFVFKTNGLRAHFGVDFRRGSLLQREGPVRRG